MSVTELYEKLNYILSKRDMQRLSITKSNDQFDISVDLHNYSTKSAKRFLGNLINICNNSVRVKAIHGYRNGTAIRRALYKYASGRADIVIMPAKENKGVTYFCH